MENVRKFQANTKNPWCALDGYSAILDVENGQYYRLNDVGTLIWEFLKVPKSLAEICSKVSDEFDVSVGQAENDIEPYIEELVQTGLVFECQEAAGV